MSADLPLLEVSDLSQNFGGLAALDGVSFKVRRGEIVGLIGPNGSGKTTLLNIVCGRLDPTRGEVRLAGRPITGHTPESICRAGIAGTFQLARIPDALDARDNVAVAAMHGRRRLDVAAARAEAERLLARVGFAGALSAHADALAYFDHKRIELARALACAPDLLLLDEWLAGLNPTELEAGIELVRSLLRRWVDHRDGRARHACHPLAVPAHRRPQCRQGHCQRCTAGGAGEPRRHPRVPRRRPVKRRRRCSPGQHTDLPGLVRRSCWLKRHARSASGAGRGGKAPRQLWHHADAIAQTAELWRN